MTEREKRLREMLTRAAKALRDAGTSLRDIGAGTRARKALHEAQYIDAILAEPVDSATVSPGA